MVENLAEDLQLPETSVTIDRNNLTHVYDFLGPASDVQTRYLRQSIRLLAASSKHLILIFT